MVTAAGVTVHVTVNGPLVGSGGMTELAETIREELIRFGTRNGSIFRQYE